jgi:heme exporter protein D
VDEVTWAALAAVLTGLGAAWTWYAFRNRGLASGLRGAGLTLLPPAAWLTGTLEMFTEIGGSVADWATGLVLDPRVWAGVVLSGLAVVLLVVSGVVRDRALASGRATRQPPETTGSGKKKQLPGASAGGEPAVADDDLSEIEEILRRRGIS